MEKLLRNANISTTAILLFMLFLSTFMIMVFPIDGFSIVVIALLYLMCAWNIYAYLHKNSMWPRRFVELDSSGDNTYRSIAFWSTLVFYFSVLFGITLFG